MRGLIKKILLQEGRVEDMKKKYPEQEDIVDFFVNNDPSNNNKYLQWMMKQVVNNGQESGFVLSLVRHFHQNVQRLQKKDINQYKTLQQLQDDLSKIGKSEGEKERKIKRDGAHVVFENDNVIALRPLNHEASCKYGAGTKWCVTMKGTDKYWKDYTEKTSTFGGTDWYNTVGVEERVVRSFWDKVLGRPGKTVTNEVKNFVNEFPVGILYFVIFKRRVESSEWDDEVKTWVPKYGQANSKHPLNKLALLYKPDRDDFGDTTWSEFFREGDFFEMIGDRLDAAHNNLSIFNALDEKVTLRGLNREFGEEFSVPFRFIEHDFQTEKIKIMSVLRNVIHKVTPLLGAEGSDKPMTWIRGMDGRLNYVPTSQLKKYNNNGKKRLSWGGGSLYGR